MDREPLSLPRAEDPSYDWVFVVARVVIGVPVGVAALYLSVVFLSLSGWSTGHQTRLEHLQASLPGLLIGGALGVVGALALVIGAAGLGRNRLIAALVLGPLPALLTAVAAVTDRF